MTESISDLTHCTDEALITLLAQHEKKALLILFDRHADSLYRYTLPLVRRHNPTKTPTTEDITQRILIDIFTTLWDNRQTLNITTSVRAWLFPTAYTRSVYNTLRAHAL